MPPRPESPDAPRPSLTAADLARRAAGLRAGERLTVVGIDRDGLGAVLAGGAAERGALRLATEGLTSADAVLDRLLDDLADLALARWPDWAGPGGAAQGAPSGPWLRAASRCAAAGRPPRFRRAARGLELAGLLRVLDPAGPVLAAEIDPASPARARPVIEALEWCAGCGAAVVATLPVPPPEVPPYDRILYGAVALAHAPVPAAERFIAPRASPLPRAHPASAIERRVGEALAADAELGGLFAGNAPVPLGTWGAQARVDLLCAAHRVVVELDGPEHRAEPAFGNDRQRDYELLAAGYLVLRLTNAQVEADLPRAVEKIRTVVRLRRGPGATPARTP